MESLFGPNKSVVSAQRAVRSETVFINEVFSIIGLMMKCGQLNGPVRKPGGCMVAAKKKRKENVL